MTAPQPVEGDVSDADPAEPASTDAGPVRAAGPVAASDEPASTDAGPVRAGPAAAGRVAASEESEPARPRRPLALSPSRATDFKTCPLLYRYRAIDRLPEAPSALAVRGTLVHSALERMFGRPADERTPDLTAAELPPLWEQMANEYPQLNDLIPAEELPAWLTSAQDLVRTYFSLEDPRRFTPEACELAIEIEVGDGVPLRGFIDRLDRAATGQLRVVDYKTGRSPGPDFEAKALYQLKFYALMIFRMRGVVPAQLKLIYLADALSLVYSPTEAELQAFESGVAALWEAIVRARETGHFPARQSRMCGWCSYQPFCPEFGGTSPPYPGAPECGSPGGGDDEDSSTTAVETERSGAVASSRASERSAEADEPESDEPESG